MKIRSFYLRDDKEEQAVKEFIKTLRANKLTKTEPEPEPEKPQKSELGIYDVHKNMSLPMLSSWEQYQQYPWVFEQARNALIRDFDGQQVTMDVIIEYVERRLKLIDN